MEADIEVEELFSFYRSEADTIASRQFDCGFKNPIVRALDVAPPPRSPAFRSPIVVRGAPTRRVCRRQRSFDV